MIFKQLPTMVGDLNKLGITLKSLDAMKLGTVGVNLGNVEAYRTALKGLSVEQSVFALASKGATEEQIRQILVTDQAKLKDVEAAMAKAGLTTATKALNAEELIALATKKGISDERAKEIASALGLIATEKGQIVSKKQLTVATLQQVGATDAEITAILGLNAAETTNIGITNVLTASFTKLWAVITAHPIGAILTAVGTIAVGTIAYINKTTKEAEEAIIEAHENAKQALEDTKASLSDDKSELQSVNSELETTKERLKEISSIGAPTLTEQNELTKLSTTNAQLEAQQKLLENNIKLKQKAAALDAKELLDTQVEMEYSSILDNSSITSKTESYNYADHARYQASNLQNAYNIYMNALNKGDVKRQQLAQELIDATGGENAVLTSELLEIVESFKYDDGTIIEGYEDIYNEYMGMIYNLQSLTNPDTFLEIAKSVTSGTGIDYEKAISDAYALAYEGNFVDVSNLNQEFVKALADAGIDDTTIEYIFKLKQQEYQSVVDSINQKYNPEKVLAPTYLEAPGHVDTPEQTQQKELDRQNYEKQKEEIQAVNDSLTEYARENPIEFQLVSSYDEDFALLDKYIAEEKAKAVNNADYVGDYVTNAIQRIYDEAKVQGSTLDNEITVLSGISETVDNLNKKVKPVMDSLKSAYQDIFTEDGFTLDNVGVDMLNSVKESIAEINEIEGIDIATSSFEDFARVLTDTETTEEQAHKAFNDLVGDIINGTNSLNVSSEAVNVLVQSLEEMGVTNAKEVVDDILSIKENLNKLSDEAQGEVKVINDTLGGMGKEAVTSTNDLTECTWEEIEALISASNTYGFTADKIKEYAAQKIWSNQNALDVSQDISQLLVVAKSAGIATKAIARYEEAKKLQKQGYGGGQGQVDALMKSAYQEILDEIQTLYNFELPEYAPKDSSFSGKSSKDSASDIDWIETKLNNVDKVLDKLNSTIDDTYSNWTDRNTALKDAITDTEKAIGLQGQAYDKYMQKAESIKLPEYLKERVRLGDMSIQNDVNSDTKELIDEYSEWYEKAQEAKEAQDELNKSLLELKASTAVDMIEEYYDTIDEAHSNSIESTQNKIDKAETMGFFANGSYYDNIGEELAKQKTNLEKKKADLDKVLTNSGLDKNSSSYTELQNLIDSISNEIQQLTIDIEDNKNAAQENEWNYFDYLRESVVRLIDEANFFIELMSNEDLFDDKGNFTKYADTTLALHNSNYEVYMANAREYAEEMKALEEDLADGKDVIDRYRELEDTQRDAIKSAQDERNAILDLVEEGYQKQLDYLNEIIDKKKEALNAEKD